MRRPVPHRQLWQSHCILKTCSNNFEYCEVILQPHLQAPTAMTRCYLDICIGDSEKYTKAKSSYDTACALLSQNAATYGLPPTPEQLSEEQRQILTEIASNQPASESKSKSWLSSAFSRKPKGLVFQCPPSLLVGRLVFELNSNPGLAKTTGNFAALCTGEKGACKNAPKKQLWYRGCSVHRIVKGYVAQGGDITRGDGSGGEVCDGLSLTSCLVHRRSDCLLV